MKVRIVFYVMVLLTVIGCTQNGAKLPEGTWKMVNFQYYSGDTLKANDVMDDSVNQVKIWTPNYFTFVGRVRAIQPTRTIMEVEPISWMASTMKKTFNFIVINLILVKR